MKLGRLHPVSLRKETLIVPTDGTMFRGQGPRLPPLCATSLFRLTAHREALGYGRGYVARTWSADRGPREVVQTLCEGFYGKRGLEMVTTGSTGQQTAKLSSTAVYQSPTTAPSVVPSLRDESRPWRMHHKCTKSRRASWIELRTEMLGDGQ